MQTSRSAPIRSSPCTWLNRLSRLNKSDGPDELRAADESFESLCLFGSVPFDSAFRIPHSAFVIVFQSRAQKIGGNSSIADAFASIAAPSDNPSVRYSFQDGRSFRRIRKV